MRDDIINQSINSLDLTGGGYQVLSTPISSLGIPYMTSFPDIFVESHFQFTNPRINVSMALYNPGKILVTHRNQPIAMSGKFSGCRMVQFRYADSYYFAHIFLLKGPNDTRMYWNAFIQKMLANRTLGFSDFIMFDPFDCAKLASGGSPPKEPYGIIAENQCYFTFYFPEKNTGNKFFPVIKCDESKIIRVPDPLFNYAGLRLTIPERK